MSDPRWAVTLVFEWTPAPDLDVLVDYFAGGDASFGQNGDEITVMASAEAAHDRDAEWVITDQLFRFCKDNEIEPGNLVESRVMAWDRWETELEKSNLPDLVSAPEVGQILGVSRQRVHQLISENQSFPPPLVRLGSGPIWLRSTIEAFSRSWTRKPGRPRLDSPVSKERVAADVDSASGGTIGRITRRREANVERASARRGR